MKKITIITVVLNNLTGIKKTYCSIKRQTIKNFEWIVIDGDSKDGFKEFMKNILGRNCFPIFYISEIDKGIYDAMNKGINMAVGDFILFLNAGDTLFNEKVVENLFNYLKVHSKENIIYGNYYRIFKNKKMLFCKAKKVNYIKHGLPTSHQAILYPSLVLKKIKYNLLYTVCSDYYITAKAKEIGAKFKKINLTISCFNVGGFSQAKTIPALIESAKIQKKILNLSILYILLSGLKRFINMMVIKILKHNGSFQYFIQKKAKRKFYLN